MSFSERNAYTTKRSVIQLECADEELRTAVWNVVYLNFLTEVDGKFWPQVSIDFRMLSKFIWADLFKKAVDEIPDTGMFVFRCKSLVMKGVWYSMFDFIEFLSIHRHLISFDIENEFNRVLAKHLSGYRIIDHKAIAITSSHEISSIEQSITSSLSPVKSHLQSAIAHLSNRDLPDFRNSIKESISAVESQCKLMSGNPNSTLYEGIMFISNKYNLPKSLATAWKSLYSYSSSSQGIRHGLTEKSELTIDDAIYMLVSCSAFINYLKTIEPREHGK